MSSGDDIKTEAYEFNYALHEFVVTSIGTGVDKSQALQTALKGLADLPVRSIEEVRMEAAFQNLCLKSYDLYHDFKPAYDEIVRMATGLDVDLSNTTAKHLGHIGDASAMTPRKKILRAYAADMRPLQTPSTPSRKSKRLHSEHMYDGSAGADIQILNEKIEDTYQSSNEGEGIGSDVEEVGTADKSNPVKGMRAKNVTPPFTQPNLDKLRLITVTNIGDLKNYMSLAAQKGEAQMIQYRIGPKGYYESFLGEVLRAANANRVIRLVDGYQKFLGQIKVREGITGGLHRHNDDPKFIKDILSGVQMVVSDGISTPVDVFLALQTKLRAARMHRKYFGRGEKSTNAKFDELEKLGKLPAEWVVIPKSGQTYSQRASVLLHEHYGIDAKKIKDSLQPVKVLAAFIDATSTGILLFADPVNVVSQFRSNVTRRVKSATAIGIRTAELMPELMEFFDFFGNNIVEPIWERKELKVVLTAHPKAPWDGDLLTAFDVVKEGEGSREIGTQGKESRRYSTRAACTRVEDLDIGGMELDGDDASLA